MSEETNKPTWVKRKAPRGGPSEQQVRSVLEELDLNTVCREANCPNVGKCWGNGTATFMILGDLCTRNCRFCDVRSGEPGGRVDPDEGRRLKEGVKRLNLDYVVLTSVDRDDLQDGGAGHFARVVEKIKELEPRPLIETLTPDFSGKESSLKKLATAKPDVFGHNLETVRRLTPSARDRRAGYELSLSVLREFKSLSEDVITKSSLMLGLGESKGEIEGALGDLREAGVEIVTLGQYLRPSPEELPVERFWSEEEFRQLQETAEKMGFKAAVAGPFVRSSYKAKEAFYEAKR